MTPGDVNGAIQDMTRVMAAASRLISRWSASESVTDPETELEHIQANLNHVRELMST